MNKRTVIFPLVVIVLFIIAFLAWKHGANKTIPKASVQPVTQIQIDGPAAESQAELSGLAWYGKNLVLLPQYPGRFSEDGDGTLFYLTETEIAAYLDNNNPASLTPRPIEFVAPGLEEKISDYQGFESIDFYEDQVFLTIESGSGTDMMGHIIKGEIAPDLSTITLDTTNIVDIPTQAKSANHSDESILVLEDKVITFYEVIGKQIVPSPVAHVFDFELNLIGTLPMDNLEYRLTDTALAEGNEFWAINYFFPGDVDLATTSDPISEKYGTGQSQSDQQQIERLVKFEFSTSGIHLLDVSPVYLMLDEEVRNWEGLVMLDERGFLMATDKYPSTILALIPVP
ncbi:MAG: hypothetical protein JW908_15335 [Anaerolineales bacterium]|nr:hypothetical protein [Anaerolineales bacterium]